MEIRRLKHLVALANTSNFGRAAQECNLSPSAFSRSIQAAEEELGLVLFDRDPIEVKCTTAGAFVVERARRVLMEQNSLERDVSLFRDRAIGDLAVGAGPYPAASLMPCLLVHIRQQFPKVNIHVEVNRPEYLLKRLRSEELDFYVADLRFSAGERGLVVQRLGLSSVGFFVRPGHPLLSATELCPEQVFRYGIATVYLPPAARQMVAPIFVGAGAKEVTLSLECNDLHLLKLITMETDTVLSCPEVGATKELADGTLVQLPMTGIPNLYAEVGIISLEGRTLSPMAHLAIEHLVEFCVSRNRIF